MRTTAPTRLLFAATLMAAGAAAAQTDTPEETAPAGAENYQLTLQQMRTFTEVFERIKRDYVESVDDATLMRAAIRGMLSDLDPHTAYLDEREYDNLEEGTSGRFNGIGIEVVGANGEIRIVSPIDDTPAARAGVKPGDIIRAIDGHSTEGLTLEEAVEHMRGEPGSPVDMTLYRESTDEVIELTLMRDVIRVKSVNARLLESDFGYLRITAFQNDTPDSTRAAVEGLIEENGASLRGLVMDLRSNPGGVLGSAVGVADLFLADGLIVYTEGRAQEAALEFNADADQIATGTPIVVLIDSGTASASEIVAGALQDQQRAVVMGEPSFGKGSVQTVLPLTNGSAVKMTTALYFTPDGRSIQAKGIRPDITVRDGSYSATEGPEPSREADLPGHLENGEGGAGTAPAATTAALAQDDFQLYQALHLLKGASLLTRNSATQ